MKASVLHMGLILVAVSLTATQAYAAPSGFTLNRAPAAQAPEEQWYTTSPPAQDLSNQLGTTPNIGGFDPTVYDTQRGTSNYSRNTSRGTNPAVGFDTSSTCVGTGCYGEFNQMRSNTSGNGFQALDAATGSIANANPVDTNTPMVMNGALMSASTTESEINNLSNTAATSMDSATMDTEATGAINSFNY